MYDPDTGLYYLQSRYYDPVTGRFVNADVYCDTGTGSPLSTNMYAYCENNALNFVDPHGTDAIWLQDFNGVYWLGHTSLLMQNRYNSWVYFYWGDNAIQVLVLPGFKFKNLTVLNNYLKRNMVYGGYYDAYIYFRGDYSRSVDYAFALKKVWGTWWGGYNVTFRNCMQVSAEILRYGNPLWLWYTMTKAIRKIVPNKAFLYLSRFYRAHWSFIR